jgi:hypothetical protein
VRVELVARPREFEASPEPGQQRQHQAAAAVGIKPIFENPSVSTASSAAMRRSQASAIDRPDPGRDAVERRDHRLLDRANLVTTTL